MATETKFSLKEQKIIVEQLVKDLEDLQNYLRDLLNFIPLPLAYVNPNGIILEANTSFGRLFNSLPENLIGSPVEEVFKGSLLPNFTSKVLEAKYLDLQVSFKRKEKERFFRVLANVRRTEKGEAIGYYLLLFDVTDLVLLQKQLQEKVRAKTKELEKKIEELANSRMALLNILSDVEEARRKAEEERLKVQSIIDSLSDGLIFYSASKGILEIFNIEAERIFQLERSKVLNKNLSQIAASSPLQEILDKLAEGKTFSKQEINIPKEKVFELTIIRVSQEEKTLGFAAILHDVTREKFIERLKSEFVSIAAHQLRTPLSAIKWTLRMILDKELGPLNKDQLDLLEKTYQSNERMIRLINDLLNVARIEEGRYIYRPKLEDITEIIQEIVEEFQEKAKKKEIKLGLVFSEKSFPKVIVDKEKIKLAISNLVDNAVKYTPEGGIVTLALSRYNQKGILLVVQDTGVGIPKDQQDRVFSRFFRGANVVMMETSGTGLGLYITKNIIEAHGGKIWFESKEGKGTKFYVILPITKNKK